MGEPIRCPLLRWLGRLEESNYNMALVCLWNEEKLDVKQYYSCKYWLCFSGFV